MSPALLPPVPMLTLDEDSADFGRSHVNGSAERRLRLASSSPNVKALFDNSPATYSYSIEDDDDSTYMTPQSDYWHPLPPPIVCLGIYPRFARRLITGLEGIWDPGPREAPGRCNQAWFRFALGIEDQGSPLQTTVAVKPRTVT